VVRDVERAEHANVPERAVAVNVENLANHVERAVEDA
jgi:hypothetical protein